VAELALDIDRALALLQQERGEGDAEGDNSSARDENIT